MPTPWDNQRMTLKYKMMETYPLLIMAAHTILWWSMDTWPRRMLQALVSLQCIVFYNFVNNSLYII